MVDRSRHTPRNRLNVRIELGRARLPAERAAELVQGSVVTLESLIDEPVDVVVDGRLVARGEVLVLEGSFCIRITELLGKRNG